MASWRAQKQQELLVQSIVKALGNKKGGGKSAKGGGKSAGKATNGKGSGTQNTDPSLSVSCRCCGRTGHQKADCYHKGKQCLNCGQLGHIAAICTARKRNVDQAIDTQAQPSHPTAWSKDCSTSWFCHECDLQIFDSRVSKCPACQTQRLQTKQKQLLNLNVEEILQKADAADHLEILEEEQKLHETIKELNASIAAAEKRGSKDTKEILEKELADVRKSLKKPSTTKAEDVKLLAGESARLAKQLEHEERRLQAKISDDHKALAEFDNKKKTKLKELEVKYHQSIQALETSYVGWIETTQKEIVENGKKLQALQEEHARVTAKLSENIVLNTTTAVVLPKTVTDEFMQKCIASQPILAGIGPEQNAALVDLFRKFCDEAVNQQQKSQQPPLPFPKAHGKAPPPTPTDASTGASSGLQETERGKRSNIDADDDVDLMNGVVLPPPLKVNKELTEEEKAAERDHAEAERQLNPKAQ